jgi:hypothetical protein
MEKNRYLYSRMLDVVNPPPCEGERRRAMDGTSREMKHAAIDSAITRLNSAVNELQSILSQIKGEDAMPRDQKLSAVVSPVPPLGEFLSAGATRITAICERVGSITKELKDVLF